MGSWFAKLFKKKTSPILIVGLDNAGKTSMVQKLTAMDKEITPTLPTVGYNLKEVKFRKIIFSIWDLGGQVDQRNIWKHYYVGSVGIVFVIDVAQPSRFAEARKELVKVLQSQHVRGLPCLILGNKSDLHDAVTVERLTQELDIMQFGLENQMPVRIQTCSAKTGNGLEEGFTWLSESLPK
jgi:small GTP-binding protein